MNLYKRRDQRTVYCRRNGCSILVPIVYRRSAEIISTANPIASTPFDVILPMWFKSEMEATNVIPSVNPLVLSLFRFFVERKIKTLRSYTITTSNISTLLSLSGKPLFRLKYKNDETSPELLIIESEVHLTPSALKVLKLVMWYYGVNEDVQEIVFDQTTDNRVTVELDTNVQSLRRPAETSETSEISETPSPLSLPYDYNEPVTFGQIARQVNAHVSVDLQSSFNMNWGTLNTTPVTPPTPISLTEELLLEWR